jgi:Zn-dependent protease with chaperone function
VSADPVEPDPPPAARLNPFVFPSDTTFRFLLLVVAVIGANLYVWNWLHTVWGIDQDETIEAFLICGDAYQAVLSQTSINDPDSLEAANDAFSACLQAGTGGLARWMIGGTALLLSVTAVILVLLPRWIERRRDLRPLTGTDAPAVVAELRGLAGEAALREEPRWVWSPLDPSPTGLAFGRPGSHAIALNGGLVTRHVADPPAFRAVARHELAHLRNRDVDLTYATIALWYAFLLAGVLPFSIALVGLPLDDVFRVGWRLVALAVLVYLTRNAVLRAREVYADVRASVPDGRDGALRRILAGMPQVSESTWKRLWRVHPAPTTRLTVLDDTRLLFPLGLLVAFGTGVATTIAHESTVTLFDQFVDDPITINLLAAAVFAPLAMGAVGVGIWRGAWGRLAEGRAPPSTWRLALAFSAGLLVGPELSLERLAEPVDATLLGPGLWRIPWIAALVVGVVLILAWVRESGEAWTRAVAGSARPTAATVAGLVVSSGMLAFFVGVFFALYSTRPALDVSWRASAAEHADVSEVAWVGPVWLYQTVRDTYALIVITNPIVFVSLVAVWLFPLAAWLRRRDQAGDAPWAFLDAGGRLRFPPLERGSLQPWRTGVLGGLACLAAFVALRLGLRAGVDADTRSDPLFPYAFVHYQLLLALLAQAVAAMVATARARTSGLAVIEGLAAAFATGVIATAGIVVGPTVAGCVDPIAMTPGPCEWIVDASGSWLFLRWIVADGAVIALAGGLFVLGVQTALRRRQAPVPVAPPAS